MIKTETWDDWALIQHLFEKALELQEDEVDVFLKQACVDKPQIREEIEGLLKAFQGGKEELESSPVGNPLGTTPLPRLDGYELISEIHRGGQGTVFRAIQLSTKREVAVKLMHAGHFAGEAAKRRFEREVELVGGLRHAGIVPIFDSGLVTDQYFYAMEYVEGVHLDEYVSRESLTTKEILRLFAGVCDAVNHAQQRGVVHRDLKPSNILIDNNGKPRILDFGIAKSLSTDMQSLQTVSMTGQVMGTLAYMSPEQASGTKEEIDTRTDVYALGVVLYELLTGELPYELDLSLAESLSAITNVTPDSRVLKKHRVDGEVSTILLKALHKEKDRRYGSAGAMGEDIVRYLRGDPIEAKRDSSLYVIRKVLRRNYKTALACAAFLAVILTSSVVSFGLYISADRARDLADRNAELYESQRDEVQTLRDESLEQLYVAEMNLAGQSLEQAGGTSRIKQLTSRWVPGVGSHLDLRGWEWFYLQSLVDREFKSLDHGEVVWCLQWHPTDQRIVLGDGKGGVWVWDSAGDKRFIGRVDNQVRAVGWSCDGNLIAGAGPVGPLRIWRDADGQEVLSIPHDSHVLSLAWHPGEPNLLVFADVFGSIQIWDVTDKRQIAAFEVGNPVQSIRWCRDGAGLTLACQNNRIQEWSVDPPSLIWEHTEFEDAVFGAQSHPFGRLVAACDISGDISIFHTKDRRTLWKFNTGRLNTYVCWSPDGRMFASVGEDRVLRLFRGKQRLQLAAFEGHQDSIWALDWHHDGNLIATGSHDNSIRVWDTETPRPHRVGGLPPQFRNRVLKSLDWHGEGHVVAAGGYLPGALLIDPNNCRIIDQLSGPSTSIERVKWSPDGKRLAAAGNENNVTIWDTESKSVLQQFEGHARAAVPSQPSIVHSISWSADQRFVASSCQNGQVFVWRPRTGEIVGEYKERWLISSLDWHPTRNTLAMGCCSDDSVKIWDFKNGISPTKVTQFDSDLLVVRWSPDGTRLAASSQGGIAKIVNLAEPTETIILSDHTGAVTDLAWSPDGKRLATTSEDLTLKVWDTASGAQTLSFRAHDGAATCIAWSPDGTQLVSCGQDSTIKIWDATGGYRKAGLK